MVEAYATKIRNECGAPPTRCPWSHTSDPLVQDVLKARAMAKAGVSLADITPRLAEAMGVYESAHNGATAARYDEERARREAERSAR